MLNTCSACSVAVFPVSLCPLVISIEVP